MGMGALAPLISVSNAADLETQRCIAYGICNLASAEHHRDAIIHEGGLVPLISLACSEDVDDQLAAIGTLRGLAATPQYRINIVAEGAIEPLTLSGERCTDTRVLREVTQCAMSLALQEQNKMPIAESGTWVWWVGLLAGHAAACSWCRASVKIPPV